MSGQSWCNRVRELHLSSKTDQELPVCCCWEQPSAGLWTGWRLLSGMNKKDGSFYRVLWLAGADLQYRWSLLPPAGNGHGTKVNRLKGIGGTSEMLLFPQFCPADIPASNVLPVGAGWLLALAHLPAEANFHFFCSHLLLCEPSSRFFPWHCCRKVLGWFKARPVRVATVPKQKLCHILVDHLLDMPLPSSSDLPTAEGTSVSVESLNNRTSLKLLN